jgi:peroxiredoxin
MKLLIILACFSFLPAQVKLNYNIKVRDINNKVVNLRSHKNKAVLFLYFSMTCKSCAKALDMMEKHTAANKCLTVIGIITSSEEKDEFLEKRKKAAFPPVQYYDEFKQFKSQFGIAHVPATICIDTAGSVAYEKIRFRKENYADVLAVYTAKVCGRPPFQEKMENRYYGNAVCELCHLKIFRAWEKTRHAAAYKTIAKKFFKRSGYREGYEKKLNPKCLKCHTVGFPEKTGFSQYKPSKHLTGVQCESCHSAAGAHDGLGTEEYEEKCTGCHNTVRDPTFNYKNGLKKLDHP